MEESQCEWVHDDSQEVMPVDYQIPGGFHTISPPTNRVPEGSDVWHINTGGFARPVDPVLDGSRTGQKMNRK